VKAGFTNDSPSQARSSGKNLVADVTYRLRAKYPIKAKVPASNAYDYYNPDTQDSQAPVEFVVE